jgi:hypothetical protein
MVTGDGYFFGHTLTVEAETRNYPKSGGQQA